MKERTLNCGVLKILQLFSLNLSNELRFEEVIGRFSQTVPGPKNLASLCLTYVHAHTIIQGALLARSVRQGRSLRGYWGESPPNLENWPFRRAETVVKCISGGQPTGPLVNYCY